MTAEARVESSLPRPLFAGGAPAPQLTIAEEVERFAPGLGWRTLCEWPPDVFAVTSAILAESGAYRCVVCPPAGRAWPPAQERDDGHGWEDTIRRSGIDWAQNAFECCGRPFDPGSSLSDALSSLASAMDESGRLPLTALDLDASWRVMTTILTLHAMADEACAGVGREMGTDFQRLAAAQLGETGSLSRLPTDRIRVLPKLRPPEAGIALRSLSHNLAVDRSEVQVRWEVAPPRIAGSDGLGQTRLTLLLVPYPYNVYASDFRPVRGPLLNMDDSRFGFCEYSPQEPFDPGAIVALVESARRRVGPIDAVVLPEAGVDESVLDDLQGSLCHAGVPYLIAGVRRTRVDGEEFGANYAHMGGDSWQAPPQHKHHRWCLDPSQVHQYQLGAALDPDHRWWEAIEVQRRSLTFVTLPISGLLTVCPLVCEDLARPDPVTDVIRAVAPTLVVALLLDGPQLAARWPARYASVLADDPGCSVLTLTALGMALRSRPPGLDPSRVVALWKDPHRGLHQIALADGARAIALTAHRRPVKVLSADGRRSARPVSELVLSGLEQIS